MSLTGSQLHGRASRRTPSSTSSFLVCGISNAMDGTEDDLASDDLPAVDHDVLAAEDAAEDGDDVDDMGDPFSDGED